MAVQVVLQGLIAVNIGVLSGRKDSSAGKVQLITLICLQLSATIFTGLDTANDFWGGFFTATAYAIECAASCLLLAGSYIMDGVENLSPSAKELRVIEALNLSVYASNLLMFNLFAPIGLTAYDLCASAASIHRPLTFPAAALLALFCLVCLAC